MTDPRAFLSFLRLTTDQNLNQKQTGNIGWDPQVLLPVSGSPKRSIYSHLNASRPQNHPFRDSCGVEQPTTDLRLILCLKTASTNQCLHIALFNEFCDNRLIRENYSAPCSISWRTCTRVSQKHHCATKIRGRCSAVSCCMFLRRSNT